MVAPAPGTAAALHARNQGRESENNSGSSHLALVTLLLRIGLPAARQGHKGFGPERGSGFCSQGRRTINCTYIRMYVLHPHWNTAHRQTRLKSKRVILCCTGERDAGWLRCRNLTRSAAVAVAARNRRRARERLCALSLYPISHSPCAYMKIRLALPLGVWLLPLAKLSPKFRNANEN